jgi:DNA-binding NarL/FixJ family response regulator
LTVAQIPRIAATLFPEHQTIQTHMRNSFRKLDVSSRVDVARLIERAKNARNRAVEPHLTTVFS